MDGGQLVEVATGVAGVLVAFAGGEQGGQQGVAQGVVALAGEVVDAYGAEAFGLERAGVVVFDEADVYGFEEAAGVEDLGDGGATALVGIGGTTSI